MNKNENSAKVTGIVSLVLSLLGLCCLAAVVFLRISAWWLSVGCLAFSVTALILGAVSRKKKREQNSSALAGFIISIITLALFVILWSLIISLFFFFADVIHLFSGLGQIG